MYVASNLTSPIPLLHHSIEFKTPCESIILHKRILFNPSWPHDACMYKYGFNTKLLTAPLGVSCLMSQECGRHHFPGQMRKACSLGKRRIKSKNLITVYDLRVYLRIALIADCTHDIRTYTSCTMWPYIANYLRTNIRTLNRRNIRTYSIYVCIHVCIHVMYIDHNFTKLASRS